LIFFFFTSSSSSSLFHDGCYSFFFCVFPRNVHLFFGRGEFAIIFGLPISRKWQHELIELNYSVRSSIIRMFWSFLELRESIVYLLSNRVLIDIQLLRMSLTANWWRCQCRINLIYIYVCKQFLFSIGETRSPEYYKLMLAMWKMILLPFGNGMVLSMIYYSD
jgi:hypothetical protein